jgi:Amt family ammonium transporter
MPADFNAGDTAWVLAASALVMLMTPGVAFFYGGLARVKSVLNMIMMSLACLAVVSVLWVLVGYSLAFGQDAGAGLIGNLDHIGLDGTIDSVTGTVPTLAFVAFQLMFAIITPALISGAIADRAKFSAWVFFVAVWSLVVYAPIAHWVFYFHDGDGGWIADRLKAIDFAGGTAVHMNAGAAALALALILGKRVGWPKNEAKPHNIPFIVLGAALLWFGWFGFNAGSAVGANGLASVAFLNTQVATAAAIIGWLLVERLRGVHMSAVGASAGAIAGLVAITPACASVSPLGALAVGVIAGALCSLAVSLKYRFGFDDSLDVVAVHFVGGLAGALLIGFFATAAVTGGVDGLLYGGGLEQLGKQAIAAAAVGSYSFVLTYIIGKAIDATVGFRVTEEEEVLGIDAAEHGEVAYDLADTLAPATGHRAAEEPAHAHDAPVRTG